LIDDLDVRASGHEPAPIIAGRYITFTFGPCYAPKEGIHPYFTEKHYLSMSGGIQEGIPPPSGQNNACCIHLTLFHYNGHAVGIISAL
jgi:hypothetical protein